MPIAIKPNSPNKNISESIDKKNFKEDEVKDQKVHALKLLLTEELKDNKALMEKGDGDSSSGSDSAPSDDNMNAEDILKIMPAVDKKTK